MAFLRGHQCSIAPMASVGETSNGKDPLTHEIIGAVFSVSSWLGPGLLESAYEECLCIELGQRGLRFDRQPTVPFTYRAIRIEHGFRPDLIVEEQVIVEVKAVRKFLSAHEAQLLTYLRLSGLHVGLMIDFHEHPILNGIKRMVF